MPTFDDLLLNEEDEFDRMLLSERSFDDTLIEEETTPWQTLVGGIERAGELTRTSSPYDPLSLANWGRSWTTIARLLPGQEDLAEWEEQDWKRQILTGAQIGVIAPLLYTLIQTGVASLADIRNAFKYNKVLKKTVTKAIRELKPKFTEPGQYQVYTTEPKYPGHPATGIRRVSAQKVTGEEVVLPLVKGRPTTPPSMTVLAKQFERGGMAEVIRQVKAPFAVVETVKRDPLRVAIERLAKTQLRATVPTSTAIEKTAIDISKHIVAGLPTTFKPQVAETMIDQALKLIAAAIPQLKAFNSFTIPKRAVEAPVKELVKREFAERPVTPSEVGAPREEVVPKAGPLSRLTEKDFIQPTTTTGEGARVQKVLLGMKDKTGQELYDYAKDDAVKLEEIIRAAKDKFRVSELMSKADSLAEQKLPGKVVSSEYIRIAKEEHYKLLRAEVKTILFPEAKAPVEAEVALPPIRERAVGAVKLPEKKVPVPVMKPGVKEEVPTAEIAPLNWVEEMPDKVWGTKEAGKRYAEYKGYVIEDTTFPGNVRYHIHPPTGELSSTAATPEEAMINISNKTIPLAKREFDYLYEKAYPELKAPLTIRPGVKEEIISPITDHQMQTIQSLQGEKKFSPRLMKKATMAFADKPTVEALDEREAAALIEGMKAVPLRPTGKPYIPAHRGDLLPSHFFTKGRAAGVESWVVPAWREMEIIGAKEEIYDPVETAYIAYQLEAHDKFRLFTELKKSVKGVKGAEKRLFNYLNGTLPTGVTLSPEETVAATELRTILDDYADRLGLPPERRLENYIYHLFEASTQRELREKYPFTDEAHKDVPLTDAMISALGLKVPEEIFTPTLLKRLGKKQGLVEDVWKAMRAVTSIDLRRIYMQPALEKVRPLVSAYPETSRAYINDWLSYAVLKQQPPLDKIINATTHNFTSFMERATKGKISFGSNPMKTTGYVFTRLGYGGAIAFNIAIVGKNLTQQLLILPLLHNPVHYGQAIGDLFTAKGQYLLKQSQVLTERFPMEAFDPKDVSKWLQKGMEPYKLVDWLNVSVAFLAGARDAVAMNLPPEEVIKYGDRIAKVSQYSYRPIDMPRFMWQGGGVGRMAGMLQTWPINYFTNYLPELVHGTVTGYDTAGNKLPAYARGRLLEHLIIASLFIYSMYKFARVDFRKTFGPGVMPTYLAPTLSLTLALGQNAYGLMTNDYELQKDAQRKLSNSVPIFIPAGLQTKKTYDAYKRLTEGVETDWAGRWRRNVSVDEAIKGVFTYPAERSDFWDTQNKVWELDGRMRNMNNQLLRLHNLGANYNRVQRLQDKQKRLAKQRRRFAEKLELIKQGYPTEDDREWIEKILHTWSLWP